MSDQHSSPTEPSDWREKYLQSLDDSEALEQDFQRQQELLRRALVRVSLAADGQDESLDQVLADLRDRLRKQETDELPDLLRTLESVVLNFDQGRTQRSDQALLALRTLCDQLQKLEPPRAMSADIKLFSRDLHRRVEQLQEYPQLLNDLSKLQGETLAQLQREEPSFMGKLLGQGAKLASDKSEEEADGDGKVPERSNSTGDVDAIEKEEGEAASLLSTGSSSDSSLPPPSEYTHKEADFSSISTKVTRVLSELLNHIEPVECVARQAESAREKITRGLSWYELVPVLEDIRDLVMQTYLAADQEFATYLGSVNQELQGIYAALGGAVGNEKAGREAAGELKNSVQNQVSSLENAVATATDIDDLKTKVNDQIEHIQSALARYEDAQPSEEGSLTEQLQSLVERIQSMETESKQTQESLEEQRHKATHDPLTQLPNREAYNERAFDEFQRWQRYKHPLTMAVCDIDFFKKVNDNYGHQAGDRVLVVISKAIAKRLREVDFIARYGGEEFVVLLPETNAENSLETLNKIREAIAGAAFRFKDEPVQITLSMGISEFTEGDTVESVFARADKALYAAKDGGRNQCQVLLGDVKE